MGQERNGLSLVLVPNRLFSITIRRRGGFSFSGNFLVYSFFNSPSLNCTTLQFVTAVLFFFFYVRLEFMAMDETTED